jgi:hypothetical protein
MEHAHQRRLKHSPIRALLSNKEVYGGVENSFHKILLHLQSAASSTPEEKKTFPDLRVKYI